MRSMSSLAKNASVKGGPPGRITARIWSRVSGRKSRHSTVGAAASIYSRYHCASRGVESGKSGCRAMAFGEADDGWCAIEHACLEVLDLPDENLGRTCDGDPLNVAFAFELQRFERARPEGIRHGQGAV